MYLTALGAEGFRNLETFRLEPGRRFNVIEGRNGQGKTSFLEAVYLLAAFRSPRDARTSEMIRFGAERARIHGEIVRRDVARTVTVELRPKGKQVTLDGKVVTSLPSSFAHLNAVVFGPDDLELTKSGPASRRRFLDRAIYAVWPEHLVALKSYKTALESRNKLLKEARLSRRAPDQSVLEVFEHELARHGARIIQRRHLFLEGFRPLFEAAFGAITDGELVGTIGHDASAVDDPAAPPDRLAEAFAARLATQRDSDARLGYTKSGPHADDLDFRIGGRPARIYASQGQHRAFVLALKIAELERIRAALGVYPVFLLDDVSSELDEARNRLLMETLDKGGGQVFITTTDRRWIRVAGAPRLWRVEAGRISHDPGASE
ncbi:MAG: DNA replication/repair protein RecF [Deltaproteobacteria bacterium]|nr:DNA replication/repair protein RecF [Deltaproteobacteria bacterium]